MTSAIVLRKNATHKHMAIKPLCFYCGRPTFHILDGQRENIPYRHTKDHVFSKKERKVKGVSGATVPCCARCNQKKGSMRPGDFIKTMIDPSRWPVINWSLICNWGKSMGKVIGWNYSVEEQMAHRFSNSKAIREDIIRRAKQLKQPEQHITAKLPVPLYYSLVNEIQRAIQETLQEAR